MTVDFVYSKQELYELWLVFRDNPNAVQMLSDFIGRGDNRQRATELIQEFEIRAEASSLNAAMRGKADRTRKHI